MQQNFSYKTKKKKKKKKQTLHKFVRVKLKDNVINLPKATNKQTKVWVKILSKVHAVSTSHQYPRAMRYNIIIWPMLASFVNQARHFVFGFIYKFLCGIYVKYTEPS